MISFRWKIDGLIFDTFMISKLKTQIIHTMCSWYNSWNISHDALVRATPYRHTYNSFEELRSRYQGQGQFITSHSYCGIQLSLTHFNTSSDTQGLNRSVEEDTMEEISSISKHCCYSISQEICTRFLLYCALLWLYIVWFPHIHQAYFTGTVAI